MRLQRPRLRGARGARAAPGAVRPLPRRARGASSAARPLGDRDGAGVRRARAASAASSPRARSGARWAGRWALFRYERPLLARRAASRTSPRRSTARGGSPTTPRRPGGCSTRALRADPGLGPRRPLGRRHVELQLGRRLAARAHRDRRRDDRSAGRPGGRRGGAPASSPRRTRSLLRRRRSARRRRGAAPVQSRGLMPGLLAHPDYTRERVRQVARRAAALVHADARAPDRMRIAGPVGRIPAAEAAALEYRDATPGMALGPLWATWWLAVRGDACRAEWEGEQVDLLLVTNSEATLWLDGEPVQGLVSGGAYVRARRDARRARRGRASALSARVEIACNGLFGWSELNPQPHAGGRAAPRRSAWSAASWRASTARRGRSSQRPRRAGGADGRAGRRRRLARRAAARAQPLLQRVGRRATARRGRAARAILGPLLAQRRNATRTHEITAVGHAHIDTAWLWPLEETFRKCVRTFATQLRLMERYPGYRFACSQAQQYAWIRDRAPGLWARIRERVAAGQWLPVGGTWIEPDCNLPAGESLVRQFLYGQRFFERELGRRATRVLEPRRVRLQRPAAADHARRRHRRLPHAEALLEPVQPARAPHLPLGRDRRLGGARALPAGRHLQRRGDRPRAAPRGARLQGPRAVGAQPARLRVGRRRRRADGADARDARARRGPAGRPAHDDRRPRGVLRRSWPTRREWPEVVGELYLEYHRGTYTTQARTKRASRRAERALHDAELLGRRRPDAPWPREELDGAWQTLLLNHFHDILPGSSIGEVHARAERDLAEVEAAAGARARPPRWPARSSTRSAWRAARWSSAAGGLRVRRGAVVRGRAARRGPPTPCASREDGDGFVARERAPARGPRPRRHAALARRAGERARGDGGARATCSSSTRTARPTSRPGTSTRSTSRRAATARRRDAAPRSRSADPLRAEVAFERPIGRASRMRQRVRLDAESARLEFHCAIDWHEDRRALKVRFPVAVHAPRATYEMQFGVVERPTHYSTRRDLAQYEVPGHRFADLSEHGFGVALLSAATYGWSVHGGDDAHDAAALAALARPRGRRRRARAGLRDLPARAAAGRTPASPPRRCASTRRCCSATGDAGEPRSWFSTDAPGLLVDTVKRAEDGDDADRPPLRGPRRPRHGAPARRRAVRRGVVHQPARGPARRARGRRRRGRRSPTGPFEIVTLVLAEA